MSGCVSVLRHLLLGTEVVVTSDWIFSSTQQTLEKVPDDLVDVLARRS
jgi:hypothetical protein